MNKILVVDDSKTDVVMIRGFMHDYETLVAYDGLEAMEAIRSNPSIDIMILDLNMPRMNGFEVLEAMRDNPEYKSISTIILTNYGETENEIRGLELGAVDYIRKPLNLQSLRKRMEVHINLRNSRIQLEHSNLVLEQTVHERTRELVLTRDITINALIGLLEVRNIESSNHTVRTQRMVKALCEHLRTKKAYTEMLTRQYIDELTDTAPLHDIGKVGIPDHILLKPGKLDYDEYEIMKKHVAFGIDALSHDISSVKSVPFIRTAIEIVSTHHEKYDGTGYPKGLKNEEIPLAGRIMAIIDVYDALLSKRVYKPAMQHSEALEIIRRGRGTHFDPGIVDAFMEIEECIGGISAKYGQKNV